MIETHDLVAAFDAARKRLTLSIDAFDVAGAEMTQARAAFEQARTDLRARIDAMDILPDPIAPQTAHTDPGAERPRERVDERGYMIDDGADYFTQEAAFARLVGA